MPDSTSRDRLVQSQYEAYPYPERDPADAPSPTRGPCPSRTQ